MPKKNGCLARPNPCLQLLYLHLTIAAAAAHHQQVAVLLAILSLLVLVGNVAIAAQGGLLQMHLSLVAHHLNHRL